MPSRTVEGCDVELGVGGDQHRDEVGDGAGGGDVAGQAAHVAHLLAGKVAEILHAGLKESRLCDVKPGQGARTATVCGG